MYVFSDAEANGKDVRRLRAPGSLELDWSYAGRSAGSNSAPYIRSLTVQATSYGVRADGYSDDSDAIQRAIEDVEYRGGGTVILPSGRIRLERQIRITASNTILRGAGMDKTTFDIPNSLRHYGKRKGKKIVAPETTWSISHTNSFGQKLPISLIIRMRLNTIEINFTFNKMQGKTMDSLR